MKASGLKLEVWINQCLLHSKDHVYSADTQAFFLRLPVKHEILMEKQVFHSRNVLLGGFYNWNSPGTKNHAS